MKQYVRLSFAGIDPDEVTQRLGIEPTQAHKSGDERGPGLTWRQSYWELTPEVDEGEFAADAHFRELLKVIEPRFAAIRALGEEPTISWVVHVGPDEGTPDGVISAETLRKLSDIGAALNVDMYFDAQGPSATRGHTS